MPLKGVCVQCGDCCRPLGLACINLIEMGDKAACGVYAERYDNMPVFLVDAEGRIRGESACRVGKADDEALIEIMRERDLSRCSLEVTDG